MTLIKEQKSRVEQKDKNQFDSNFQNTKIICSSNLKVTIINLGFEKKTSSSVVVVN